MIPRLKSERDRINSALEDYKERYRRETLDPLELSGVYALFPDKLSCDDGIEGRWPATWPHSTRSGVYFLFTEQGELLYIGTAWHVGARLGQYFHYDSDRRCKIVRTWSKDPAYLLILAVPEGMSFEAAALEEFFIERVGSIDNKVGRVRDDPSEPKVA